MNDDEMYTLLEDAVADVEPRRALADIQRRTARTPRRSWVWGVGGAVAATAATVAAVVALTHLSGGGTGPTPAGRPTVGPVVLTYYVGKAGPGLRLFPERRHTSSSAAAATEAVRDTVIGVSDDPDHLTVWPAGVSVSSVERRGGRLTVDLAGPVADRPAGTSRGAARLALQQVVYTAQAATGTRLPVTLLVDGAAAPTVLGESTSRPVAAASVEATVSPVYVLSPAEATTVDRTFTVTGRASTFEGNVQWELRRDVDSRIVRQGYATAQECCQLSPYSFRVTAPAGQYTLIVHDEDVSDGEGTPATHESRSITVR